MFLGSEIMLKGAFAALIIIFSIEMMKRARRKHIERLKSIPGVPPMMYEQLEQLIGEGVLRHQNLLDVDKSDIYIWHSTRASGFICFEVWKSGECLASVTMDKRGVIDIQYEGELEHPIGTQNFLFVDKLITYLSNQIKLRNEQEERLAKEPQKDLER